ncbi:hypothetical protein Tco_0224898, partial [Tanacetum coccineum]
SSQNPSSPEITPKEEYVTLDKPESPNPFLPATQVEFTFDEIAFTTNDEVALVFSVQNWTFKPNQPEEPSFTSHMKAICNLDVPVDSKAPEPSSQTEEVPQGKNPGAKSGLKRK